jgi:hypothetical protein
MTFTSSLAMGFMGICLGSAQSLICGNAQYHSPFSLHLEGGMSLNFTGAVTALNMAEISLVQLVWVLGVTLSPDT